MMPSPTLAVGVTDMPGDAPLPQPTPTPVEYPPGAIWHVALSILVLVCIIPTWVCPELAARIIASLGFFGSFVALMGLWIRDELRHTASVRPPPLPQQPGAPTRPAEA